MRVNMMWVHVMILLLVKTASPTPIGKKVEDFFTLINILGNFCFMFKEILKGPGVNNRLGKCFKMYEKKIFSHSLRNSQPIISKYLAFFLTVWSGCHVKNSRLCGQCGVFLSAAMLNHRLQNRSLSFSHWLANK